MGEACKSSFCLKSSLRNCPMINEEKRQQLFKTFWEMQSWEARRTYVRAYTSSQDKGQCTAGEVSKREKSFQYFLEDGNGIRQQVCRFMFCSTLGVSEKTIQNWRKQNTVTRAPKPSAPMSGPHKPVSEADMKFLSDWLHEIPVVPSHYCRKQKTYEGVKFIYNSKTLVQLHQDYVAECALKGKRSVARKLFTETFKKLNFSFFVPRKDQCDKCIAAKLGNLNKHFVAVSRKPRNYKNIGYIFFGSK